jgi:hypothetical protein
MPFARSGTHRLYYEVTGTGRPVVFVQHCADRPALRCCRGQATP